MIRLKICGDRGSLFNENHIISVTCDYYEPPREEMKEYRLVKLTDGSCYWVEDTIDEIEKKIKTSSIKTV